jgi:hypothetical protein
MNILAVPTIALLACHTTDRAPIWTAASHSYKRLYMAADCPVCRSEGWAAQARVLVSLNGRSVIATLNVVTDALLAPDEASLSDAAWAMLDAAEGARVVLSHPRRAPAYPPRMMWRRPTVPLSGHVRARSMET